MKKKGTATNMLVTTRLRRSLQRNPSYPNPHIPTSDPVGRFPFPSGSGGDSNNTVVGEECPRLVVSGVSGGGGG
ncbi:hypothetical protein TIFTF001_006637 [Ficus carica]|uniref:Uncharacterized protein n=1 Tax=Ficus carica TaxID=3494 RepID=A0AA87ZPF1_FICCA|nr:hypothetical protein TIFTF001_006637 [Ficus carica]